MGILIIIAIVFFWYTIKVYNNVKPLQISIKESDSNIGIMNRKREIIINKLNEVASSYGDYEKGIIENISNDLKNNGNSLFSLNRLYGAYPDLKLNNTFFDLIDKLYLVETERQEVIQNYNDRIKHYNYEVTSFPAIIVCSMISFKEKTFFN